MKVYKNLMGNNDKIHADEIVYKDLNNSTRAVSWGVVIESGSNENGHYIRYGDGTQICSKMIRISSAGSYKGTWVFPANFKLDLDNSVNVNVQLFSDPEYIDVDTVYLSNDGISGRVPKFDNNQINYFGYRNANRYAYLAFQAIGRWK